MSAVIGALRAELSASIAQFQSDMGKAADSLKGFTRAAKSVASDLEAVGLKMSLAITAPLLLLAKSSIDAAEKSAQAIAVVEAALASTGGQSGRTAAQLEQSATALAKISIFDHTDILRNVTANLLTFGNIQGTVFDRGQKLVVNMASKMGTDLQSATIKWGRALNDPLAGIQGLTRAGIQFTQAQKDQIKTLIVHGQYLAAQNILLDVGEKKFNGAGAALLAASPTRQLQKAWIDFEETLGAIVLQVLPPFIKLLSDVLYGFGSLSPSAQKLIFWIGGIAAVIGPLSLLFGGLIGTIAKLLPWLYGLATALFGVDAPIIAVVAGVAAAAIALFVFWNSMKDILSGQWAKAWDDAKKSTADAVKYITGLFKFQTPKIPVPDFHTPGKVDFNTGDASAKAAAAAKELQNSITQTGNALSRGLDAVDLPKATVQANAFNRQIDDFVKKAADAGVNVKLWGGQIATLRTRISELQKAGLAKEAIEFQGQVDKDQIAVNKFAKGGLPALEEKLNDVDANFKDLTDTLTAQIAHYAELAKTQDDAAKTMEVLKRILAGLPAAHDAATKAARAQAAAEEDLAHLASQSQQLQTSNAIRDFNVQSGRTSGPVSSAQENLQKANDDLAAQQIDTATTLRKMEEDRATLVEQNVNHENDQRISDATAQIKLQSQLNDLVQKTTGEQIDAANRINEAYKQFGDDVSSSLLTMVTDFKGGLKGLLNSLQTLVLNAFVKPLTDQLGTQLSAILKQLFASLTSGAGGGGPDFSAFFKNVGTFFDGMFADGGRINAGHWGIAGENGPEPIYGGSTGVSVVSNKDATMGRNVTQIFNITSPDATGFRRGQRQIARAAKQGLG